MYLFFLGEELLVKLPLKSENIFSLTQLLGDIEDTKPCDRESTPCFMTTRIVSSLGLFGRPIKENK